MTLTIKKISIITAIRNQFDMNKLYWEYLDRYTYYPYQLIIIDNASDDGSGEYFAKRGAHVIRNEHNYSYPYCQNQGLAVADGELIAFLNNDLILSPEWDRRLVESMNEWGLDFVSPASNDRMENQTATLRTRRRWKRIKYPFLALFGATKRNLLRMHQFMYGNWERWQQERLQQFGTQAIEGFSGSCIIATRQGLEKVGSRWDERIQAADMDLYLRTSKRAMEVGDVKPIHVVPGVYFHHYSRLTLRSKHYVPFADAHNLITIEDKWGDELSPLTQNIDL